MAHNMLLPLPWSPLCILSALLLLPRATSQQEQLVTPTTSDSLASYGTVCISNCATCPVICSPSPPSSYQEPNPPSPLLPPPSTPKHHHRSPPPEPYYYLPPPPPLLTLSPPEYEYASPLLGGLPGPPPPPFKFSNTPFTGPVPPNSFGPHDYSYPYYNFYASKATFPRCDDHFLPLLFVWLMFLIC